MEARDFLRQSTDFQPDVAIILGSGLGGMVDEMEIVSETPTGDVPHLFPSRVQAHDGTIVLGTLAGCRCIAFRGRVHLYEGYLATEVVRPVRLSKLLGASTLVVTNAAGGIHPEFQVGDLMVLTDHLNLSGTNPLLGDNIDEFGPRFPDMTEIYDPQLRTAIQQQAKDQGFELRQGVYAGLLGPSYETPAEIRMLRTLGADAVGMSTVAEAIAARHAGLRVLGLSSITNAAAGLSGDPLNHEEVLAAAHQTETRNRALLRRFLAHLAPGSSS